MAEYTLKVTTGSMLHAGTFDNLYVTLIGTERQSERTQLTSLGLDDTNGKVIGQTKWIVIVHIFFSLNIIKELLFQHLIWIQDKS